MKKVLSFLLILQFFTNHEAFAELVKIPFLFHHYNETGSHHHSFADFIKDHYTDNHHADSDHDHGKLPFKHSNDGCSNHPSPNISVVITHEHHYTIKPLVFHSQKMSHSNESIYNSFVGSIWQPPKLG